MATTTRSITATLSEFVGGGRPPAAARARAAQAFCDTLGVILAGIGEAAPTAVRATLGRGVSGSSRILGTADRTSAPDAALANGVAAHALDYDDMCFVSLAHPSCALVPAVVAAAELARAPGRVALEGYVVGFELECRLGAVMNPRHYHGRGWHCTSTIGTVGAAAAAARVLGLDPPATAHALGIAASAACGLKENIGSMVKPLHAGLAARNGVFAVQLAQQGFVASEHAIDGPQGYLVAMDSERPPSALAAAGNDLDVRWEILETGVTVKLYPSCAATHPPLDALLDLVERHGFSAEGVDAIEVEVDSMTPRLLIHERPTTGLEAKFSMPFCAAAAVVFGRPTIDTFSVDRIRNERIQAFMPRVSMRANQAFDHSAPLSQARVTVRLRDGRTLTAMAEGARGYPGRLSEEELAAKFLGCAAPVLTESGAREAWAAVRDLDNAERVEAILSRLVPN
jgi:2-methylcitrate dehydratase PrpD